jgi:hypothetical protein
METSPRDNAQSAACGARTEGFRTTEIAICHILTLIVRNRNLVIYYLHCQSIAGSVIAWVIGVAGVFMYGDGVFVY